MRANDETHAFRANRAVTTPLAKDGTDALGAVKMVIVKGRSSREKPVDLEVSVEQDFQSFSSKSRAVRWL